MNAKRKASVGLPLAGLALVFLSPWLFALLWQSSDKTNYGLLIEPPQPLPEVTLATGPDSAVAADEFQQKWDWLIVAEGACPRECIEKLDLVRQVRLAQKKHARRLRYTLIVVDPVDEANGDSLQGLLPQEVVDAHPELRVRIAKRVEHDEFVRNFLDNDNGSGLADGRIFVVDPLGNLMMSYESAAEAEHLHSDMERLLKASHVG